MKIKWLGHSSFLVTSERGVRIITDPYKVQPGLSYAEIAEAADIVLVSHEHGDHNNSGGVKGNPKVLRGPGVKEVDGLVFKGVGTYHDDDLGRKRGSNTVFAFNVDGIRVCHLGDLGHVLGDKEAADIGPVDVLFVPIGGFYTIDSSEATRVVDKLSPRVAIPMHFKTAKVDTAKFGGISGEEGFIKGKADVNRVNESEVEFEVGKLPKDLQIVVLRPAL